jgi:predicted amidophosphoribosyltransferase
VNRHGPPAQAEKFVWPPRPVEVLVPQQPQAEQSPPEVAATGPAMSPSIASCPAHSLGLTPWQQRVREIERVWLGLVTPPLPERMAEAGWMCDLPEAYCGRCGTTVGPGEADSAGCALCRGSRLPWERLVRLGEFDGLLREIIHEVKFTRWRRLGDDLGHLLGGALADVMAQAGVPRRQAVVVPICSSWRRRMARGIDHALVLARGVSAAANVELVPALQREHRPTQTDLPRSKRRANVAGSIRVKPGSERWLAGKVVVLVDDVTTTRATLAAASRGVQDGVGRWCKERGEEELASRTRIWAAIAGVTPAEKDRGRKMAGLRA